MLAPHAGVLGPGSVQEGEHDDRNASVRAPTATAHRDAQAERDQKRRKGGPGLQREVCRVDHRGVGTMACAYVFALIALISLPDAIRAGRPFIISWIAQTFLQLVLLSIIMVGQSVQAAASDARAAKEFADTEVVKDRLDEHTAGGIRAVLDRIDALEQKLTERT